MALTAGDKFGSFDVLALIGKGGMGEVYKARDLQLKREVALKVLPGAFANDPDRLARFQREAEVLASLNHPNIAAIYGIAQSGGAYALVMELVIGESPKGPMPWDQAWKLGAQMTAALEYAHDKGVVHRDLKPANVMVTADGVLKLLDFGLAKAMSAPGSSPGSLDPENSPTLTMGATVAGTIMGTAGYMAPEQAKGKVVDKRADIWAFGVVLWELLTGERLFKGEDVADTLAQVLTKEADVTRVPDVARKLLTECLQKDPKARLRDIGDAPRLVGQAFLPDTLADDRPKGRSHLPWVAAAVFAIAAGVALWAPWRTTMPVSEVRFQIPRPARNSIPFLSPDGQRIALINDAGSIAIRELNALETRDLPLARVSIAQIIWSPDSRSIAYQSRDFKLMKMAIDGSPPVQLADLPTFGGGSWNQDGIIIVGVRSGGLKRVPVAGGMLEPVTTLTKGQTEHLSPQFIGGGRFLYQATGEKASSGIYVASLTDPSGKVVLPLADADRNSLSFSYAPPLSGAGDGHILYASQNVLLDQAVDPSSLEPKGSAVAIGQDIQTISASPNGTLIYLPPTATTNNQELRWLDRTGKEIPNAPVTSGGSDVTISPSGKRWGRSTGGNIWLHDVAGGAPSRFTFEPTNDRFFTWSPDDQWIAYATGQGRAHDRILRKNALTSAASETLVTGGSDFHAHDWSRDGKFLLFSEAGKSSSWDLWTLDLQAKGAKPVPYLQTPAGERSGAFSPDGHWIAYESDESGRDEVYLQSFPLGGGKFQVSTAGGATPRWRADGRELYYVVDGNTVAVKIQTSPRFEVGPPQMMFRIPSSRTRNYDVTPDGNRFLVPVPTAERREVAPATVVINWQAGVKK